MNSFLQVWAEYLPQWGPRLVEAAWVTAGLSLAGFLLALLLGALLVALQQAPLAVLRHAARGFIQFMRAVPLLALLLALYFGLPSLGLTLPGWWAGVLGLGEGVAQLGGACTLPEWRKRGAQRALLEHRLRFGAEQGCDLAMMGALPGSASQRNAEREGFRIAYTRIKWRLPA